MPEGNIDPDLRDLVQAIDLPEPNIQSVRKFAWDLRNALGTVSVTDALEIEQTVLSPLSAEPTMAEVAQFCKEARECLIYWKLGKEPE